MAIPRSENATEVNLAVTDKNNSGHLDQRII